MFNCGKDSISIAMLDKCLSLQARGGNNSGENTVVEGADGGRGSREEEVGPAAEGAVLTAGVPLTRGCEKAGL